MDDTMSDCTHHWILSEPDEDVVRGACKLCGAIRDYPASLEFDQHGREQEPGGQQVPSPETAQALADPLYA